MNQHIAVNIYEQDRKIEYHAATIHELPNDCSIKLCMPNGVVQQVIHHGYADVVEPMWKTIVKHFDAEVIDGPVIPAEPEEKVTGED